MPNLARGDLAGGLSHPSCGNLADDKGRAVMLNFHKMALALPVLWIAVTATTTFATAQEAVFSDAERLGLGTCLAKCRDGDKACSNRCISQSQTRGRVWADDVRACIRDCRNGHPLSGMSAKSATDEMLGCVSGCRLDRVVQ
jgi:hypothetical protein